MCPFCGAVFCFEILEDPDAAVSIASAAFDQAIAELESLGDEEYADTTLVLQAIRDSVSLWRPNATAS